MSLRTTNQPRKFPSHLLLKPRDTNKLRQAALAYNFKLPLAYRFNHAIRRNLGRFKPLFYAIGITNAR
jgi:hypothetical protein